ncbi:hypothetical protein [Catellatospora bangladeshensis]|uniref:Uncharacterized protein n=1 Tax=Catellatospora bangladeshensis TaxID=310355 RepID=A0A8J3JRY6_9ACTN|nr:hypothetical protein [Catellatospora bangladeshensis]GIF85906.1 hypothetical protein Cba03nite_72550 [Catellatospora bangladeshensis]
MSDSPDSLESRTGLTAAQRRRRARVAVHTSWANTADRSARTAPARQAFRTRFERQVDPDGTLPAEERTERVNHAIKAYMLQLAERSSRSRRAK